jgi:hypothetical protein
MQAHQSLWALIALSSEAVDPAVSPVGFPISSIFDQCAFATCADLVSLFSQHTLLPLHLLNFFF